MSKIRVTNPAPSALTNFTVSPGWKSNVLTWDVSTDTDVAGYLVWGSTTSGFTPSASNLLYDGTGDTFIHFNLNNSQSWYYKACAYDEFLKSTSGTGLNLTAQVSGTTLSTIGIPSASSAPTATTAGELYFNTTTNSLMRWTGSAWTSAVPTTDLTGTISASQLADGAVTAPKLAAAIGGGNLVSNSAMIDVGGNGIADGFAYYQNGATIAPTQTIVSGRRPGFNAQRVVATSTGSTFGVLSTSSHIAGSITGGVDGGWTNSTYVISWYAKYNAGTFTTMGLGWNNGPNTTVAISNPTLSTSWQRYAFRVTWNPGSALPSGGSYWITRVGTTNVGDSLDICEIQIEQGEVLTAFAPRSDEILPNSVVTDNILDSAITSLKILDAAITDAKVAVGAISNTKIADTAVTTAKIADLSISTAKMVDNAITTAKLNDLSVSTTKLVDAAITDAKVAVGAISNSKIADLAITTTKIADLAISAPKIVDQAIDSSKLADNSVTTLKVVDGAIASAKLADNSVTTLKLNDAAVSTAKIATNAITNAVMAANAVTNTIIADNAISTAKLQAGSITTAKLAAGAVTANEIAANTITAAKIASGTITSTEMAAGSITTNKLFVTGRGAELNMDPNCTDTSAWGFAGTLVSGITDAPGGGGTAFQTTVGIRNDLYDQEFIPVNQYTNYRVEVDIRQNVGTTATAYLGVAWYDVNKTQLVANVAQPTGAGNPAGWSNGSYSYYGLTGSIVPTTWTTYSKSFGPDEVAKIPSNAVFMRIINLLNYSNVAGCQVQVSRFALMRKADANLVVDGTITAAKLAANSVTTAKLAAGSITADKLLITGSGNSINADPNFIDTSAWPTKSANITFGTGTTAANAQGSTFVSCTSGTDQKIISQTMPVDPSKTYSLTCNLYGAATNDRNIYVLVDFFDINGTRVFASPTWGGAHSGYVYGGVQNSGSWNSVGAQFGSGVSARPIPSTARTMQVGVWFQYFNIGTTQVQQGAQNLRLTEAIEAPLIVDGTIVASKIAANTITAGQIAANTITAAQIAANTITSGQIAANTITAGQIAANTITAGQIAANTITTSQIAANTITASNIAAATITGAKIAAGTIAASNLIAGTITANEIASNAITTKQLLVSGNSLVQNWDFATGDFSGWRKWAQPNSQSILLSSDVSVPTGATSRYVAAFTYTGTAVGIATFAAVSAYSDAGSSTDGFSVRPGQTYQVSIQATKSADFAGGSPYLLAYFFKADGTWTTSANAVPAMTGLTTSWQEFTGTFVAPANSLRCWLYVLDPSHTAGTFFWTKLRCVEQASAEMIVDGAIITSKLTAGAVTTAKIAAGAVTANEIAANTITAAKIAGSTITATELASGSVTTAKIAANAVTANEIAAATITGAKIAAGTITASNILSNTITASQIAAGTITATQLAAGTITANELATDSVTTNKVAAGAIVAGKLGANSVGTNELIANSITSTKLIVSNPSNIVENSDFEYGNIGWGTLVTGATIASDATNAYTGNFVLSSTVTVSDQVVVSSGTIFSVFPGQKYYLGGWIKNTGATGTAEWRIVWYDKTGAVLSLSALSWTAAESSTWLFKDGNFTAPANAAKATVQTVRRLQTSGTWYWDHVICRPTVTPELIVDGTIAATKLVANSVTASQIAAGTITATQIASNTITANQIAAGTITTSQIAANTITASNIAANTITASKIAAGTITATELASGSVTTAKIAAGAVTANEIAANTITAAKIASGTITSTQIATGTITADRIATGTITTDRIAVGAATDAVTAGVQFDACAGLAWPIDSSYSFTEVVTPNSAIAAGVNTITGTFTVPAGTKYVALGVYNWVNGPFNMTIQQQTLAMSGSIPADNLYAAYSKPLYDGMMRVCNTGSNADLAYSLMGVPFKSTGYGPGYELTKSAQSLGVGASLPWMNTMGGTTVSLKLKFNASSATASGLYVRLFYTSAEISATAFRPDDSIPMSMGTITTSSNSLSITGQFLIEAQVAGDWRSSNRLLLDTSKFAISLGGTVLPYLTRTALTSGGVTRDAISLGGDASAGSLGYPSISMSPVWCNPTRYISSTNTTVMVASIPIAVMVSGDVIPSTLNLIPRPAGTLQLQTIAGAAQPISSYAWSSLSPYLMTDTLHSYQLAVLQSKL